MIQSKYTVIIQWDEEDRTYVVSLPEWGPYCKTHGKTYQEAAKNAEEVLELLIVSHDPAKDGRLPEPKQFQYPGADVIIRTEDQKSVKATIAVA